jgi:hypothetical protein
LVLFWISGKDAIFEGTIKDIHYNTIDSDIISRSVLPTFGFLYISSTVNKFEISDCKFSNHKIYFTPFLGIDFLDSINLF